MGAYEYSALDKGGKLTKGVLEGDTPRQIRQLLREKGLSPVSVDEIAEGGDGGSPGARGIFRRSIKGSELALLTRQLATLVQSGTVLEEALRTVAEQTDRAKVKSIVTAVRARVVEGRTLAAAMGVFPGVFSPLYRATVEAGEQTGRLDLVLERLADYTEFNLQLRQKIMLALLYPALLTVVALLVVGALLAYVVPQVVEVFRNIDQQLPLLTRMLISVSHFAKNYGLVMLVLIGLGVIFGRFLLGRFGVRQWVHRLMLSLPVVTKFVKTINAARFCRTFSILTASGVPVLEGLKIASAVLTNQAMRAAVDEACLRVREGASLHRTLAQSGYFPPITIHLIASGEASSNLEQMLERAAINQEREMETMISVTLGVFEPLLILFMGGVVLMIVLAILLPIFDLNQLVK